MKHWTQRQSECMINELPKERNSKKHDLRADTANGCCAWLKRMGPIMRQQVFDKGDNTYGGKEFRRCGLKPEDDFSGGHSEQVPCCGDVKRNCDFRYFGNGPAYEDMMDFVRDEQLWLRKYHEAWTMATENGH